MAFVDVDGFWRKIGRYGRYQMQQFLVTILAAFPMGTHIVSIVFIGETLSYYATYLFEIETLYHILF